VGGAAGGGGVLPMPHVKFAKSEIYLGVAHSTEQQPKGQKPTPPRS